MNFSVATKSDRAFTRSLFQTRLDKWLEQNIFQQNLKVICNDWSYWLYIIKPNMLDDLIVFISGKNNFLDILRRPIGHKSQYLLSSTWQLNAQESTEWCSIGSDEIRAKVFQWYKCVQKKYIKVRRVK